MRGSKGSKGGEEGRGRKRGDGKRSKNEEEERGIVRACGGETCILRFIK
jgi:hypothetical protein